MADRRESDVAIVGAGLAGLVAARRIAEAGRSVLVFEARDRVGGRTLNLDLGQGKVVELGGQWIGPSQDRMYALIAELGIETYPSYQDGDSIALIRGKRYRYSGEMPGMNRLVMADFSQAAARIDRMAHRVPLDRPWEAPRARAWDRETLATWLGRTPKTAAARSMLQVYMRTIFAAEPEDVSLLAALFYVHSGTSFEVLSAFEGGAQQDRIIGGSQIVSTSLAESLSGALELEAPVRRIRQTPSSVQVDTDQFVAAARRVIVAVPPTLAVRIDYDPPLPGERDQLLQRLPQGTVIKAHAVYDEPFWRREGLSGLAWSPHMPVSFIVDNSPPDGSPGVLSCFIVGRNARSLGREESAARRKVVLDCIAHYLGRRGGEPRAYHDLDWSAEVWTRGCYGALFPPGVWTQFGPMLREPVGMIHWAGTETSSVWNGYMDGAVRSGERVAREVLCSLSA
jgi:monoamine oxidase